MIGFVVVHILLIEPTVLDHTRTVRSSNFRLDIYREERFSIDSDFHNPVVGG
jgi:hypothetical protein